MVDLAFKLPPTKVVVRNLPPHLQEKGFRDVLDRTAEGSYDWLHFVQGKARYEAGVNYCACRETRCVATSTPRLQMDFNSNLLRSTKRLKTSYAHINFRDPSCILACKTALEKHTFVNEAGVIYRCNMEFAPSQRKPPPKVKRDMKENTLEKGGRNLLVQVFW